MKTEQEVRERISRYQKAVDEARVDALANTASWYDVMEGGINELLWVLGE